MSFLKLFITFFKIGAFTFGGGYAMLSLIEIEVVERNGWVDSQEFLDGIAVAQSSPGPISVNTSIFIGYKLKGVPGALVCALGTILPSFFIIVIIAMFFYQYRDNLIIDRIFMGIKPAVTALIFSAIYKLINKSDTGKKGLIISAITVIAIVLLKVNPIIAILLGACGAIFYYK